MVHAYNDQLTLKLNHKWRVQVFGGVSKEHGHGYHRLTDKITEILVYKIVNIWMPVFC